MRLYRPGVRAELEAGELGGFTVNQGFLLGTTVYVVIPSFGALVLQPALSGSPIRVDLAKAHASGSTSTRCPTGQTMKNGPGRHL